MKKLEIKRSLKNVFSARSFRTFHGLGCRIESPQPTVYVTVEAVLAFHEQHFVRRLLELLDVDRRGYRSRGLRELRSIGDVVAPRADARTDKRPGRRRVNNTHRRFVQLRS